MRHITPGLFETQIPRPDGAQPLVSIDGTGRPFYSALFTTLSEDDQAVVRAQGEEMARMWAERQAVLTRHLPTSAIGPVAPTDELVGAIGEVAAGLLAVQESFNRLAGALRAYKAEQQRSVMASTAADGESI